MSSAKGPDGKINPRTMTNAQGQGESGCSLGGEKKMKATVLETFLFGVTVGVGMTIFSLYTQKPGCLVDSIEAISESGRTRRTQKEEKKLRRERLRAVGFSDEEIDEIF